MNCDKDINTCMTYREARIAMTTFKPGDAVRAQREPNHKGTVVAVGAEEIEVE